MIYKYCPPGRIFFLNFINDVQMSFMLMKYNLQFLSVMDYVFGVVAKKTF